MWKLRLWDKLYCMSHPLQRRSTRILDRIVGTTAARRKDLVPGVARRECVAVRDLLAMAATDRWVKLLCTRASETKVKLSRLSGSILILIFKSLVNDIIRKCFNLHRNMPEDHCKGRVRGRGTETWPCHPKLI